MKFKDIKEFIDNIDYAMYLEYQSEEWCLYENEVYWAVGDDIYSGESREGCHEDQDYFMFNLYTGCGETITCVFDSNKRIEYEEFCDKYDKFM